MNNKVLELLLLNGPNRDRHGDPGSGVQLGKLQYPSPNLNNAEPVTDAPQH